MKVTEKEEGRAGMKQINSFSIELGNRSSANLERSLLLLRFLSLLLNHDINFLFSL